MFRNLFDAIKSGLTGANDVDASTGSSFAEGLAEAERSGESIGRRAAQASPEHAIESVGKLLSDSVPANPRSTLEVAQLLNDDELARYLWARFFAGMKGVLSNGSAEKFKCSVDCGFETLANRKADPEGMKEDGRIAIGECYEAIAESAAEGDPWPLAVAQWVLGDRANPAVEAQIFVSLSVHAALMKGIARGALH